MKRLRTLLVLLACACLAHILQNSVLVVGLGFQTPLESVQNGNNEPLLNDDFANWLEDTGKHWGMKGIAIAVTRKNKGQDGWTTETKGYGVADKWGNPVNEETLFSLGSNSKLFTALAMGLVLSNTSLDVNWNTKIKDLLPDSVWALQDTYAQDHANLIDILSHRTGMPRHDLSYGKGDTVEGSSKPTFTFGNRWMAQAGEDEVSSTVCRVSRDLAIQQPYALIKSCLETTNIGPQLEMYTLASHIISQLSATPFVSYVYRRMIVPLGLLSTTYNTCWAEDSGKLVDGFINAGLNNTNGEHGEPLHKPIPYWNRKGGRELVAGAGGVISNANDMATWLQVLLQSGRSPSTGVVVIPASVVEKVSQGVAVVTPTALLPELSPKVYGMGQERYTYQGHELIEHAGGTIGQTSLLMRSPHEGIGIAVLTNWDYGAYFQEIVKWRLLEKALGLKELDWNERYHKLIDDSKIVQSQRKIPRSPDAPPPSLSYHKLEGMYFNPAYGSLGLCAYPPPQAPRKECEELISEAGTSLGALLKEGVPTLLGTWPKIWSTHVVMQHFSGDFFNASPPYAFPAPFPDGSKSEDDSRPFAVEFDSTSWQVQFVFAEGVEGIPKKVDGMAWTGIWGASKGVEPGDKHGVEVWFDRVV